MVKKLEQDLHQAMKARDAVALRTLRLAVNALRNAALEKRVALTDEESLEVLRKQVRLRKEAAVEYRKGKREDLAAEEEAEQKVLEGYLPPQVGDDEILAAAREAVQKTGATTPRELGKVMGVLMPQFKGRADGTRVRALAEGLLKPKPEPEQA